ncbi:mechanosensitive ion channel family protein [Thalassomonas sp. M1454]|uniref:mechanosensitive ion channel family protein n=1 Tax=Thalassomonas sp. M1454 TaxID=2594477 RepID=UPI00117F3181|nr:mechanosensitive ion channel family protein [Thalassomonas sp. M1454]TRX58049.1 mechanosensitive ion channel family protein [Thalassomonas sp. M1454]
MSELIQTWLVEYGLGANLIQPVSAAIGLSILLCICWLSYYFAKYLVLNVVHKIVTRSSNTLDDLMIEHKVFTRTSWLVPIVLLLAFIPVFISENPLLTDALTIFAKIALALQVARSLSSLLNVTNAAFQESSKERYLPLNATVQLLKLAIYMVATILAISVLIDRSPIYLLSGLGALTAVLLLVFQDTIKGLVASIQISANKMVAPGDWISMPQYGADGDVLEIALNTVKIRNFDNTLTTVPTYALISESFKNWRGMSTSGGRRIKRSLSIDVASIHFCSEALLNKLDEVELLKDYLAKKNSEVSQHNTEKGITDNSVNPNSRRLTNIGTFRAYITAYLQNHPKVHDNMTCMVRQLAPTDKGVALELYFFSNDTNWVNYEGIQADIFDHLFSIAPLFELRIFQTPTGYDWQKSLS